ncbi:hypothetical protein BU23DRAFT_510362 [Bimuria novae-zelandiae CBS 107.79]|uniref:Uncharacterized protein n=1 Tax=Bimuria novae-zelandiae CBS 107.79 TaxID=1447943 RepID=A0A6A5V8F1_9PLEO|nr:hypothetical protein BU23DRAFT_510362 [Bimuria novae-zelandiae CBS 107.79]
MRLLSLRQEVCIWSDKCAGHISRTQVHLTAEFYRVAAILYLYNTYPGAAPSLERPGSPMSPKAITSISALVRQAFMLLDRMDVCASPWPLFIVACNVKEDRDRIEIMRLFDEGSKERRIGNYDVVMGLVKAIWNRVDLNSDQAREGSARVSDWREFVDVRMGIPPFA